MLCLAKQSIHRGKDWFRHENHLDVRVDELCVYVIREFFLFES